MSQIVAAIDVGTNTIKLLVGTKDDIGGLRILAHKSVVARLGEGVDSTHVISPDVIRRGIKAIKKLIRHAEDLSADTVRIVGTSALRDAENREDMVRLVERKVGLALEVLSENDECRLSYLAAAMDPVLGEYEGEQLVFDSGGGSTELAFGIGHKITCATSLNIGAVRLTERYLWSDPPTQDEVNAAVEWVDGVLSEAITGNFKPRRVIGIGGTIINLSRMHYGVALPDTLKMHGSAVSTQGLRDLRLKLCRMSVEERCSLVGLDPDRAGIIAGGSIVVERLIDLLGVSEIIVSIGGLRYGILYEMLSATGG